jgi:hypothetical protein
MDSHIPEAGCLQRPVSLATREMGANCYSNSPPEVERPVTVVVQVIGSLAAHDSPRFWTPKPESDELLTESNRGTAT